MKKYIFFLMAGLSLTTVHSQEIADALRYSQNNLTGTARFQAMSGAFGALGGDFSSLNINPAGSAIFLNNQVGFTLSNYNVKNQSYYFGTKDTENNTTFHINQAGAVFVFNNDDLKSDWKKFTIGLNYENTNNFDNTLFAFGNNPNNSIANYFLSYANPNTNQNNIPVSVLEDHYYDELNYREQQAFLGYQGYIINVNPTNTSNDTYVSNVPAGGNYYQENYVESKGNNGKATFNVATQYKNMFYFGMNLNTHFVDYRQYSSFYEDNNQSQTNGVRSLLFENDLYTYGTGFSIQFGAIAKVTPALRLGLAYESQTWYTINDELKQNLSSYGYNYGSPVNPNLSYAYPDSNSTTIYAPYKLQTPSKFTGSLAYVFGKAGLISIDYSIKDYSKTQFKSEKLFKSLNNSITNVLDKSAELRIGAEKRIKQWSLRAGYRTEQSPYKDGKTIGDLIGYSGGFGYNFGRTKLDVAYSHSQRKSQEGFFAQGFTDGAQVKSEKNNFSLSLLFNL